MGEPEAQAPRQVLLIVRPAAGGIRQHVVSLAQHTDPARVSLSLAAPAAFLHSLSTGPTGLPVTATFPLAIAARFAPFADLRAALRLRALASDYDLIHAHGLRAGWIAALSGGRFVLTAHNLADGNGPFARFALRRMGTRAATIIAVSQAVADTLAAQGVPRAKVVVVPNGVDIAYFSQLPPRADARRALGVPAEAFAVGCVARLSPEKGVDVFLQAARLCPDMTFLVAGDGPQHQALETVCPPNARLLGRVPDTRALLSAVDVLAVPSRAEGQGIVALEAMAAHVPVVASRVGGLPETLAGGDAGLLVPVNDPAALADALRRLQSDTLLRQRLRENGSRLVRERSDIRRTVAAVVDIYAALR